MAPKPVRKTQCPACGQMVQTSLFRIHQTVSCTGRKG